MDRIETNNNEISHEGFSPEVSENAAQPEAIEASAAEQVSTQQGQSPEINSGAATATAPAKELNPLDPPRIPTATEPEFHKAQDAFDAEAALHESASGMENAEKDHNIMEALIKAARKNDPQ